MTTMWTFKTRNFSVIAEIEPEDHYLDLSWDNTGEVREKLSSGEYEAFCTRVRVLYRGVELAADYLGESIYAQPRDFFTEHYGLGSYLVKPRQCGAYFPDMVREAIAEARKNLKSMPKLRA